MDVSEEAVKARCEDLSEHVSTLTLTNDVELSSSQRLDKFFKYVDVSPSRVELMASRYRLRWLGLCRT